MSTRQPVQITVGGDIPASIIDAIAVQAADERLALDWNSFATGNDIAAAFRDAADAGETIALCRDDFSFEAAPGIAEILRAHNVAYLIRWQHPDDGDLGYEHFDGSRSRSPECEVDLPPLTIIQPSPRMA